jgi:hypothetical protein
MYPINNRGLRYKDIYKTYDFSYGPGPKVYVKATVQNGNPLVGNEITLVGPISEEEANRFIANHADVRR